MYPPHVVIIGGGFAGLTVAKKLRREADRGEIHLTLIHQNHSFVFTPLLHEAATGNLSEEGVSQSLHHFFAKSRIRFLEGKVERIVVDARSVFVRGEVIPYDRLVIATGGEPTFFAIPGAEQHAFPLMRTADAERIEEHLEKMKEKALSCSNADERAPFLSLVIVGAGATGVEMAGELERRLSKTLRSRANTFSAELAITLVSTSQEVLPNFPSSLQRASRARLEALGISCVLGEEVVGVDHDGVTLRSGKRLEAKTVIWAAGVKPVFPDFVGAVPEQIVGGRLKVNEFLQLSDHESIFALGDVAAAIDPRTKTLLPLFAQVAVQQAVTVADNVLASLAHRPLRSSRVRLKGYLVSIGPWFAVGQIFGIPFHGALAWVLWKVVYLVKFHSWRKRWLVLREWVFGR